MHLGVHRDVSRALLNAVLVIVNTNFKFLSIYLYNSISDQLQQKFREQNFLKKKLILT